MRHHTEVTATIDGMAITFCPEDERAVSAARRLVDDLLEHQQVYVITQARDGRPARVEVYSDFDVAQQRQRELGVGSTTLASRRVDDPLIAKRCQPEAGESPSQPASEAAEHVHVVSVSEEDARLAAAIYRSGHLPEPGEHVVDAAIRLLGRLPMGPNADRARAAAEFGLSELDPSLLASMSKAEREAAELADAAVKEAERLKAELAITLEARGVLSKENTARYVAAFREAARALVDRERPLVVNYEPASASRGAQVTVEIVAPVSVPWGSIDAGHGCTVVQMSIEVRRMTIDERLMADAERLKSELAEAQARLADAEVMHESQRVAARRFTGPTTTSEA